MYEQLPISYERDGAVGRLDVILFSSSPMMIQTNPIINSLKIAIQYSNDGEDTNHRT